MDIDNLSVTLKTNGADDAIRKIWDMAAAVSGLANSAKSVTGQSLKDFAQGMAAIRDAAPTKTNANNMKDFAEAIKNFVAAANSGNTTQFASDLTNVSNAAQGMSGKTTSAIGRATKAMNNYSNAANQAANAANNIGKNAGNAAKTNAAQSGLALAQSFRNAYGDISKVAIAADTLGGKLIKLKALVPTKQFKSLGEQAENVKRKYEELREKIATGLASGNITPDSDKYKNMSRQLEALINDYDRLIQKQKELALAGDGFKLNPTLQAGLDGFKKGFNGVISVVKNGFVGAISSANKHLSSFVKNITGAISAQKALQKTMSSMKALPNKIAKEITRLGKMLKLMVVRTALRQVIKQVGNGFQSLALHSDQFNNSMSNIINASKQLGYSFAAMVSPLINALAPAIVYVINLLTKLLNVINQVLSALGGATTWNKAKNFTDSWRDSIKQAGASAGKAAKEIKKTVLGFDELNQLQDNKDSGGGGGGGIADMFETAKIDPKWKEFANWLKDMWDKKDFYDLGKLLGEKLRDWLESIPWDKIRKTSNDLGKCLATLINGFVEVERLAWDIGHTVAQGVNTVFEFINGFVHNLHWDSIGKFIAQLFNGFFETIDWRLIKDTVVTGLSGIADSINAFIREFHWDNISQFVINGVDTIVSGISEFFGKVKWKELGKNLGDQLMKIVKGVDWKGVGKAIGSVFQAAIDFVAEFINQLKVDDIVKALTNLLDGFFEKVDTEKLGKTLADIIDIIIQVASRFWKENKGKLKEEGSKLLKGFFENIDTETKQALGKMIGEVLLAAAIVGVTFAAGKIVANAVVIGFTNKLVSALFGGGAAASGASGGAAAAAGKIAGASFGLALVGSVAATVATAIGGIELIKWSVFDPENAASYGVEKERLENLSETYSGLTGTARLFKEGLQELWYSITGNTEALEDLNNKTYTLTDGMGNITKTVDNVGNTVIEIVDDVNSAINGHIEVYDNWAAQFDAVGEAARIGADKMIDIHVAADGANDAAKDGITIFPKLGDNIYKAASAEDSLNIALREYRDKLKEINDPHSHYMGTLDVIREAQRKNVKVHEEATTSYGKYKTAAGEVGIYIKDNKDAYIKMGEAAKTASDDVNKYMGTTKDSIKIIADNTVVLKDNEPAYLKMGEAAKQANDDVNILNTGVGKSSTEIKTKISDMSKDVTKSTNNMSKDVTKDWTGIQKNTSTTLKNTTTDASKQMGTMKKDISSYMKDVQKDTSDTWKNVQKDTSTQLQNMSSDADRNIKTFNQNIKNGMNQTKSDIEKDTQDIQNTFKNADWEDTGKDISEGLLKGIKSKWDKVTDWAREAARDLTASVKKEFDIASPSKKWAEIGQFLDLGMVQGLDRYSTYVNKSAVNMADGLTNAVEHAISPIGRLTYTAFHSMGMGVGVSSDRDINHTSNGIGSAIENINSNMSNTLMGMMAQQSAPQYISNEIIIDGEVAARSITKAQEKMNRRYSPQTV